MFEHNDRSKYRLESFLWQKVCNICYDKSHISEIVRSLFQLPIDKLKAILQDWNLFEDYVKKADATRPEIRVGCVEDQLQFFEQFSAMVAQAEGL